MPSSSGLVTLVGQWVMGRTGTASSAVGYCHHRRLPHMVRGIDIARYFLPRALVVTYRKRIAVYFIISHRNILGVTCMVTGGTGT